MDTRGGPLFSGARIFAEKLEAIMYVPLNARKVCAFDLRSAFLAIDRKDHRDHGARSRERKVSVEIIRNAGGTTPICVYLCLSRGILMLNRRPRRPSLFDEYTHMYAHTHIHTHRILEERIINGGWTKSKGEFN